eukprot:1151268-Pelagomonas_calceolata.AAC.7
MAWGMTGSLQLHKSLFCPCPAASLKHQGLQSVLKQLHVAKGCKPSKRMIGQQVERKEDTRSFKEV